MEELLTTRSVRQDADTMRGHVGDTSLSVACLSKTS